MSLTERLQIVVSADAKGVAREFDKIGAAADRSLGKADDRMAQLSAGLTSFGTQAVLAAGVAGAGLYRVAQSASAYGEQVSRASKTFSDEALPALEEFAKGAAKSAGIASTDAMKAASTFAAFGKQIGKQGPELAAFSTELVQLAGDFASFVDITPEEALTVFQSALAGEQEAIRRYGIDMSAAAVETEALAMGLENAGGELTNSEKILARQSILLREGALFAGDFADTSDSLANRQRALAAEFENVKVALGEGAMPVAEQLVGGIQAVTGAFEGLSPQAQSAAGRIAAVGVAGVGALGGLSILTGQALKLRDAFTVVGEDGTRSMTRLGRAVSGISIGATAIAGLWALNEVMTAATQSSVELASSMDRLSAARTSSEAFDEIIRQTQELDGGWEDLVETFTGAAPFIDIGEGAGAATVDIHDLDEALKGLSDAGKFDELQMVLDEIESRGFDPDQLNANKLSEILDRYRERADAAGKASKKAEDDLNKLGGQADETASDFGGLTESVDKTGDALRDSVSVFTSVIDAQQALDDALSNLGDAERELADSRNQGADPSERIEGLRAVEDAARSVADAYRAWEDAQRGVEDARINLSRITEDLKEELYDLQGITPGTVEYDEGLDRIKQMRRDQEDAVRGVEDAQRAEQDAQRGIADAKRNQAKAQMELNMANTAGVASAAEIADAERRVRDARREVFNATVANEAAQLDFNQAMADGTVDIDGVRGALFAMAKDAPPQVQQALVDMGNAMGLFAYVSAANAEKVKNAWSFQNLFGGDARSQPQSLKFQDLFAPRSQEKKSSAKEDAVNAFMFGRRPPGRAVGGPVAEGETYQVNERGPELFTPKSSGFIMNAEDTNELLAGVSNLVEKDEAQKSQPYPMERFQRFEAPDLSGLFEGRATGGPVADDETYMVNERGPELFSPKTSGFIMNAEDTNELLAGLDQLVRNGGGAAKGTTIERGAITVVAPAPQEAASATVRRLRSEVFLRGGEW